jgi:hypothetical protein
MLAGFMADVSEFINDGKAEPTGALLFYATSHIPAHWHIKLYGMFTDSDQPSEGSFLQIQNSAFGSQHGIIYHIGGDKVVLPASISSKGLLERFDDVSISFDYVPGDYDPELFQRVDALSITFGQMPINKMFPFDLIFDVADHARLDRLATLPPYFIAQLYRFWSSPELSDRFPPQYIITQPQLWVRFPT